MIIRRPIITEKSTKAAEKNRYTFAVEKRATKGKIKEAVEAQFGVKVEDVKTLKIRGKTVRRGKGRRLIKKPDWKKAVVTLRKGDKIGIFGK